MSGIEIPTESLHDAYDRGACDLAEWKQAASVEAGLRREYLARASRAEQALDRIIEIDTVVSDGGKVHDHGPCAEIAIAALKRS